MQGTLRASKYEGPSFLFVPGLKDPGGQGMGLSRFRATIPKQGQFAMAGDISVFVTGYGGCSGI